MKDKNGDEEVPHKQYIRFGKIPPDGKSKIRNHTDNTIIGEELGVSTLKSSENLK